MARTPQGLGRLHEEAYAVPLHVRALYCASTFNVKQDEVLFESVRTFFWRQKKKWISKLLYF